MFKQPKIDHGFKSQGSPKKAVSATLLFFEKVFVQCVFFSSSEAKSKYSKDFVTHIQVYLTEQLSYYAQNNHMTKAIESTMFQIQKSAIINITICTSPKNSHFFSECV